MLVAFNRSAGEGHPRKTQLRQPSRAHARYSNDREFSTRQRAGKLPSVLKGNRKRIGKKAAQENAERSDARPNAVVVVSAMYENDQTLPLPSMYGKNLIFKTGSVSCPEEV